MGFAVQAGKMGYWEGVEKTRIAIIEKPVSPGGEEKGGFHA
jgi:hypothetical protein